MKYVEFKTVDKERWNNHTYLRYSSIILVISNFYNLYKNSEQKYLITNIECENVEQDENILVTITITYEVE